MQRLIILGTAAAVADAAHENAHLALDGPAGSILVDCAGSPLAHLPRAGLELARLRAVLLTHFHPDHVGGLPALLLGLWLTGRRDRLPILGLRETLERAQAMMALYDWHTWPGLYPVHFEEIPPGCAEPVFETDDFSLYAAPTRHSIPSLAVKAMARASRRTAVYSSDTEPCQAVVDLARGADVLLHEATGMYPGHSSPAAAGAVARQAGVGRLILLHYPIQADPHQLLAQARQAFDGPVELGRDFQSIELFRK